MPVIRRCTYSFNSVPVSKMRYLPRRLRLVISLPMTETSEPERIKLGRSTSTCRILLPFTLSISSRRIDSTSGSSGKIGAAMFRVVVQPHAHLQFLSLYFVGIDRFTRPEKMPCHIAVTVADLPCMNSLILIIKPPITPPIINVNHSHACAYLFIIKALLLPR